MIRETVITGMILTLAACERPTAPPDGGTQPRRDQTLILTGFNESDTVVVGPRGYRVGMYHDFSPYDSIAILFSAQQLALDPQAAHVAIRVGPVDYFRDTLSSPQKAIAVRVACSRLAKPRLSALTFFAADPDGRLLLAHLRVIGWSPPSVGPTGQQ